jgi:hypothetical protein
MINEEQVIDIETAAREAIIEYAFASSEEWQSFRDRLEVIYETLRYAPAYRRQRCFNEIREECEYALGIRRR